MKKLRFTVEVEFMDKIVDDNEIKLVAENIALALKGYADNEGLAPETSETYTKSVSVFKDGELMTKLNMF